MAKTSKTTKSTEAKKAAPKKAASARAASAVPKKTAPAKKAPTKKATKADPAEQLEKVCKDVVAKFQKMENGEHQELREKLEWCIGSYSYDKNPQGLVDYGHQASSVLKGIREESPRKVSKKLVDDLDKALARF